MSDSTTHSNLPQQCQAHQFPTMSQPHWKGEQYHTHSLVGLFFVGYAGQKGGDSALHQCVGHYSCEIRWAVSLITQIVFPSLL